MISAKQILFADTDSFLIEIPTDDLYKDLQEELAEHFDFSNYPKDHPLFNVTNKAVLGKFKDETFGIIIRVNNFYKT